MAIQGYNFTEGARRVLRNSRGEAAELKHEYVGTEHLILALARDDGIATSVLRELSVDPNALRQRLREALKPGRDQRTDEESLPYTTRAKKVLELAMFEARDIGHEYVGTEHLLLGLVREEKGIAAQVLADAGLTLDSVRTEVLRQLGAPSRAPATPGEATVVTIPRRYQANRWAFRLFWITLGLVVLIESVRPIVAALSNAASASRPVAWLAAVEAVGATLFLVPKTMRIGAGILLAVFGVAVAVHLLRGEFPAALLVYAAGTVLVLVQREGPKNH